MSAGGKLRSVNKCAAPWEAPHKFNWYRRGRNVRCHAANAWLVELVIAFARIQLEVEPSTELNNSRSVIGLCDTSEIIAVNVKPRSCVR